MILPISISLLLGNVFLLLFLIIKHVAFKKIKTTSVQIKRIIWLSAQPVYRIYARVVSGQD